MDRFIIRKATVKDLEDILKLNFYLFKKEYKEFDKSLNLKWTYNEGKKYFRNKIKSKNSFVEVAEYKNKIIGYSCGSLIDGFYRKGTHAEMEDAIIKKEFRRRGVGSKFAQNFLNWCKNKKVDYVSVVVTAGNKVSVDFNKKLGFKERDLILEKKLK